MNVTYNENLGYFGFSPWEKILVYMRKGLKGLPEIKYVSSFWKNQTLIKSLLREYTAGQSLGYKPATPQSGADNVHKIWTKNSYDLARQISKKLNVPVKLVYVFFSALFDLSKYGKIPFKLWNPKGYIESKEKQEELITPTIKKITEGLTATGKNVLLPIALLVAGITTVFLFKK